MKKEWVLSVRDQCQHAGVPFFFKQWGGVRKSAAGRKLDGKTYDEFPRRSIHPAPSAQECAARASQFQNSLKTTSLVTIGSDRLEPALYLGQAKLAHAREVGEVRIC